MLVCVLWLLGLTELKNLIYENNIIAMVASYVFRET